MAAMAVNLAHYFRKIVTYDIGDNNLLASWRVPHWHLRFIDFIMSKILLILMK